MLMKKERGSEEVTQLIQECKTPRWCTRTLWSPVGWGLYAQNPEPQKYWWGHCPSPGGGSRPQRGQLRQPRQEGYLLWVKPLENNKGWSGNHPVGKNRVSKCFKLLQKNCQMQLHTVLLTVGLILIMLGTFTVLYSRAPNPPVKPLLQPDMCWQILRPTCYRTLQPKDLIR